MAKCNSTLHNKEKLTNNDHLIWGHLNFYDLGLLLSISFASLACLFAFSLMFLHATHYSKPHQQRQILFMIPVYAVVSCTSYKWYHYAVYLEVARDCYEAFAISSFFSLLCNYLEDNLKEQKNYFRHIEPKNWVWPIDWLQKCTGGEHRGIFRVPRSGLTWFNIIWISVYQYCLIRVLCTFAALATEYLGVYCPSSLSPRFAQIWISCINAASVTVAMYCLIQFYVQVKTVLAAERPFLKVLCIKMVIFFSFWQVLVISFLSSGTKAVITPGLYVSYVDIKVGMPTILLTFEMTIFAILHSWAFPWRRYVINPVDQGSPQSYQGGILGTTALFQAFNPWDIIKASSRGFRWLFWGFRHRHSDPSYNPSYILQTTKDVPQKQALAQLETSMPPFYDYEHGPSLTVCRPHQTMRSFTYGQSEIPVAPHSHLKNRRGSVVDDDYNDNNPLLYRPAQRYPAYESQPVPHEHHTLPAIDGRISPRSTYPAFSQSHHHPPPSSEYQHSSPTSPIGSALTTGQRVHMSPGPSEDPYWSMVNMGSQQPQRQ